MADHPAGPATPFTHLPAREDESGGWNIVIETPQVSRNKYKYDPDRGLFKLGGVLSLGAAFPFDLGSCPARWAGTATPCDVLVLMDAPAFPGCLVPARLIGVIKAEHATPVGSGTVARTKRIPVEQRAEAAVIAWMRHETTGYDSLVISRVKGKRREVRQMLARCSQELLDRYRRGEPLPDGCPLQRALGISPAGQADASEVSP